MHGSVNAPKAISVSAIVYYLKEMISEDISLNHSCFALVDIEIFQNSILGPRTEATIVGGNFETN